MSNVQIKTSEGKTHVFIDGKEIDQITSLNFSVSTDTVPVLEIERLERMADIEGEMLVKFRNEVEPILDLLRTLESYRQGCIKSLNRTGKGRLSDEDMKWHNGFACGLQTAIDEIEKRLGVEK